MTDKEPRKTPIGYEDSPDKPTRSALRLIMLAIGGATVVFLAFIVVVMARNGGI